MISRRFVLVIAAALDWMEKRSREVRGGETGRAACATLPVLLRTCCYTGSGSLRRSSLYCRYCFCHGDNSVAWLTCTAVTLYSGQSVAQSANSVVITLAPVCGMWNVV